MSNSQAPDDPFAPRPEPPAGTPGTPGYGQPPYGAPQQARPADPSSYGAPPYGQQPAYGQPPAYGQQPPVAPPYGTVPPYGGYPGYAGYPAPGYPYGVSYPKNSLGIWALVLGIASFALSCLFVTGIPAIVLGRQGQRAADEGLANNRSLSTAGVVLGWVALGLSALVVAGLPSAVSGLLNDRVLTFLRRAEPHQLVDVPLPAVRDALYETITESGRTIAEDALDLATFATGGYPFMIQLVGYHCWREAEGDVIDLSAAKEGIAAARKRLGSTVHATALADLSEVDRTFLLAMAQDDGPSAIRDIAARMHVSADYVNVYRARLIDAMMIEPTGRGQVEFAVPYLREYLREHAATMHNVD